MVTYDLEGRLGSAKKPSQKDFEGRVRCLILVTAELELLQFLK